MKHKHKKNVKQIGCFILDKSGSMGAIKKQTISGFNEYLQTLKDGKLDLEFSLVLFDSFDTKKVYDRVPLNNVKALNDESFVPNGGTPLYDAVVSTVEALAEETKNLDPKTTAMSVVIMTDGEENASTEHTESCLKDLIEELTAKGNWTFAYMGANQDAWANAAKYGISRGNTIEWSSTSKGTTQIFRSLANNSVQYSNMMLSNADLGIPMASAAFFSGDKTDGSK